VEASCWSALRCWLFFFVDDDDDDDDEIRCWKTGKLRGRLTRLRPTTSMNLNPVDICPSNLQTKYCVVVLTALLLSSIDLN
jgi:hypothetical protein